MTNSNVITATDQHKAIEKAARAKNPMEHIADVSKYSTHNNVEYTFYCKQKADMNPKILKWAFKLAEKNVGPLYKTLAMGWQPKIKQNDLNKNWARYLVALDSSRNPVAYAMFRFDLDYGQSVLYCYEMQIEPTAQRQGLGRFMMNALERCAQKWAIGYMLDDSSPDILENAEYEILSKIMK